MIQGKKIVYGIVLLTLVIVCLGAFKMTRPDDMFGTDIFKARQQSKSADDLVVPAVTVNMYGITISFPVPVEYHITCRNSSAGYPDRKFDGFTEDDRNVHILKGELKPGTWILRIQYIADNKGYLYQCEIEMP